MAVTNWADLYKRAEVANGVQITPGEYDFEIVKCDAGKTKNGDYDQLALRIAVVSGPSAKQTMYHRMTIQPEHEDRMGWFFNDLRKMGLDASFWATNPSLEHVATTLVGRRFHGRVVQNGEYLNVRNIDVYAPKASAGAFAPPPPAPAAAVTPPPPATAQAPAPQDAASAFAEALADRPNTDGPPVAAVAPPAPPFGASADLPPLPPV